MSSVRENLVSLQRLTDSDFAWDVRLLESDIHRRARHIARGSYRICGVPLDQRDIGYEHFRRHHFIVCGLGCSQRVQYEADVSHYGAGAGRRSSGPHRDFPA